jgi:uncharacterized small protein (DUF1192 family)
VVLALALALLACSGSDDSLGDGSTGDAEAGVALDEGVSTTVAGEETAEAAMADGDGVAADGTSSDGAAPGVLTEAAQVGGAPADGRQRTFTASLELDVERLDTAVAEAAGVVEGLGGFSATEDVDLGSARVATITYRVPAERFRRALEELGGLGELRQQDVQGDDVTGAVADLESRVTTLRTSVTRLQGFLGEATDVNQIASLEGELTRREAELASVEAQRRSLADQVALSTVTVAFDAARSDPAPVEDNDRTLPTFLGGLEAGWDAAVAVVAVLLAGAGLVLPFLPLLVVAALVWRWRRSRRVAPTP